MTATARLAALRAELARLELDAVLIPHADAHQSEEVPDHARRLAWATGFTGSAGAAVVARDRAALFVDGRYTLQAAVEADADAFEIVSLVDRPPSRWLSEKMPTARIGLDPSLHSLRALDALRKALPEAEFVFGPHPIDAVWTERPLPPHAPIRPHPASLAGLTVAEKAARIGETLEKAGADALYTNQGAAIAWALNIRGGDVERTPIPIAYALFPRKGAATLFADAHKMTEETLDHLAGAADIATYECRHLPACRILLDPATATEAMRREVEAAGGTVVSKADPITRLKAVKTPAELDGAREAHRCDAVAMCRFLAWLDETAPSGELDELAAAARLEALRREQGALDLSFDTISGAGPNGAIVHYHATPETNRWLAPGSLYLVDSGGQYECGTTDITRTVAIGDPSAEARRNASLVLKGHIAIQTARFPKGTTGAQLDTLARIALWKAGLDYAHGTGHGVGSYLSVHEGPQNISKRGAAPLEAGMIVSNEPGYYKPGEYGIRLENLEIVTEAEPIDGGDAPMHGFETLTLVPFDVRALDLDVLTGEERAWLDLYHARVRAEIAPLLDEATGAWLRQATEPL